MTQLEIVKQITVAGYQIIMYCKKLKYILTQTSTVHFSNTGGHQ